MRTIREILLENHRAAEPKLDQARQEALRKLNGARTFLSAAFHQRTHGSVYLPTSRNTLLRTRISVVQSLRWHLAGLAAAWLAIQLALPPRDAYRSRVDGDDRRAVLWRRKLARTPSLEQIQTGAGGARTTS